jgi:hypothetical protein
MDLKLSRINNLAKAIMSQPIFCPPSEDGGNSCYFYINRNIFMEFIPFKNENTFLNCPYFQIGG